MYSECTDGTMLIVDFEERILPIQYQRRSMRFACARLVTRDVTALAEFYRRVLRVEPIGSECYVELPTRGGTLAISSKCSVDIFNAAAAEAAANRSVILDFQVDDVDGERDRLDDFVGEFVLEPTDQPWGTRSMLFRDPDGNLINFFTTPRFAKEKRDEEKHSGTM